VNNDILEFVAVSILFTFFCMFMVYRGLNE